MRLNNLIYVLATMLFISCGGSDSSDGDPTPDPDPVAAPEASSLVFPENNTVCNISEILSDTQSSVTFLWDASPNTDSYDIQIRNLNTNATLSATSAIPEAAVIIQRGTPYEWFVISRAQGTNETATSATFRFFNEGPGIENFAPFPAEAILPVSGSTATIAGGVVTLEWSTEDIDGDFITYEVFFDTVNPPQNNVGATSAPTLEVDATADTIYFWRIISMDEQRNSSTSPVFQFRVN